MLQRLEDGSPCAYDYTGIIRHNGKIFVIGGDLSLSKIGGLSLTSAKTASVLTAPLAFVTGFFVVTGFVGPLWMLGFLFVFVAAYFFAGVGAADKDKPLHRMKLAAAGRIRQPDHIVNQDKDTFPDDLWWTVVVKRQRHDRGVHVSRRLPLRVIYRPSPRQTEPEFVVSGTSSQSWGDLLLSAAEVH